MKNKLLILGLILIIITPFISSESVDDLCKETDGGQNYYMKGVTSSKSFYDVTLWVSDKIVNREDTCCIDCLSGLNEDGPNSRLREYYCENDVARAIIYSCPDGCANGACKSTTKQICTDTDGEKDIYTRGTVNSIDDSGIAFPPQQDICVFDNVRVVEWYCDTNTINNINNEWITCPNGCKDGACIKTEEIKEQVKCVFDGSTQLQKCYTAEQNSRAYCSGTETCIADISGYKGEKITWKSTCGGYAYTIIDGENKYAKFDCSNLGVCQPSKCDDGTITECKIDNGQCICSTCPPIIIKPVCGNGICESGEGEICKTTAVMCEVGKECKSPPSECFVVCPQDCKQTEGIYANLNEKFKLQVYQPVKILENEKHLMKITFKDLIAYKCAEKVISSEASETIKSKIAIATGKVVAPTETPTTTTPTEILKCIGAGPTALLDVDIIVNSQLGKHFILNLNVGEKKQVEDFTVSFLGYDYASRTGTFLVSRETFSCPAKCKCDENGKTITCPVDCKEGETLCPDGVCRDKCNIISEDCRYGCSYDGKCFPMGVRSSGMYCGVDLNMNSQLNADSTCDNNFECSSNVCVSGKCISEGLIQKILNWFSNLF